MTASRRRSRVHVGTSGWTYQDWEGPFYPEGVRGAERLSFYAGRFDTVEVNATFYRLPFAGMITGWNRRLPPRFHLVLKGPRAVTHHRRLREVSEPLRRFWERVRPLETLKVLLWQLPPNLPADPPLLEHFLEELPDGVRHAVEFRHPSWWEEPAAAELLRARGAAFVGVSHPRLPATVRPTADLLYLRFHGLRRLYADDYSRKELRAWVQRVRPHLRGRDLYAFFNNDPAARAPANAAVFREMLESG